MGRPVVGRPGTVERASTHLSGGRVPGAWLTIALLFAVCVAAIAAPTWSLLQLRDTDLRAARVQATNLAYSVALHAAGVLDLASLYAGDLAEDLASAAPGDRAASGAKLAAWLHGGHALPSERMPPLADIVVLDAEGRWTGRAADLPFEGRSDAATACFRRHRANAAAAPCLDTPARMAEADGEGRWVLPLSRRIDRATAGFAGVVRLDLDLAAFDSFLAGLDIGPHGAVAIWTEGRVPLVRYPPRPDAIGARIRAAPGGPVLADAAGTFEAVAAVDGVRRLYAYRRLAGHDLILFVGLARDDILAPWLAECYRRAAGIAFFVLAVLLVGTRLLAQTRARQSAVAAYRLLADHATDMVFRLDADRVRRYVSPASAEILGETPEALIGRRPIDGVHPEDAVRVAAAYDAVLAGQDRAAVTNRIRHRSGAWVWVEAELRCIRDPASGVPVGILGALRDVTRRRAAEEAARTSAARYRMLTDHTTDMITHLRPDLTREFVSPACRLLLGYAPEELLDRDFRALAHPDDAKLLDAAIATLRAGGELEATYRARRKDGSHVWVEARGRAVPDAGGYVLMFRDVSARHRAAEQLERTNRHLAELAMRDALTGLYNRRHFDQTLHTEYARAARTARPLALLMIDVDHFKPYNDLYGHVDGDACLRRIALVIGLALHRPADIAARYGGEEFAVLLPETDPSGAGVIAERIRAAVAGAALAHAGSGAGFVSVSIGVAARVPRPLAAVAPGEMRGEAGEGAVAATALVAAADRALYRAKRGGRNRVCAAEATAEPQAAL